MTGKNPDDKECMEKKFREIMNALQENAGKTDSDNSNDDIEIKIIKGNNLDKMMEHIPEEIKESLKKETYTLINVLKYKEDIKKYIIPELVKVVKKMSDGFIDGYAESIENASERNEVKQDICNVFCTILCYLLDSKCLILNKKGEK